MRTRRSIHLTIAPVTLVLLSLVVGCSSARDTSRVRERDPRIEGRTVTLDERAEARATRHFTAGSILEMRKQYPEAIVEYRRALGFDSTLSAIHYAIAKCYYALEIEDSALIYAERAVELNRRSPEARMQFAEILLTTGEVRGARNEYEEVLSLQPGNLEARYMAARLWQRGDPERSITHYEYLLRELGADFDLLLSLSELYLRQRSFDRAVDAISQLVDLKPGDPDLYRLLVNATVDAGRYSDAARAVDEAEKRIVPDSLFEPFLVDQLQTVEQRLERLHQPSEGLRSFGAHLVKWSHARKQQSAQSWEAKFYGGIVAYRLDDSTEADRLIESALADSASTESAWTEAAALYLSDLHADRAIRVLAPTASRHREEARVPYLLGYAYARVGSYDSALVYLRRSVHLDETNSAAWSEIALVYDRQKKHGASDAAYDKAVEIDPDNALLLNNYAYALAQRGVRLDKALEMALRALKAEPENEAFLDTVGWVYFKLGQLDSAVQYVQRSVDIGGASHDVIEHLGDVQRARGDMAAARAAYERALQGNPESTELRKKLDAVR